MTDDDFTQTLKAFQEAAPSLSAASIYMTLRSQIMGTLDCERANAFIGPAINRLIESLQNNTLMNLQQRELRTLAVVGTAERLKDEMPELAAEIPKSEQWFRRDDDVLNADNREALGFLAYLAWMELKKRAPAMEIPGHVALLHLVLTIEKEKNMLEATLTLENKNEEFRYLANFLRDLLPRARAHDASIEKESINAALQPCVNRLLEIMTDTDLPNSHHVYFAHTVCVNFLSYTGDVISYENRQALALCCRALFPMLQGKGPLPVAVLRSLPLDRATFSAPTARWPGVWVPNPPRPGLC